MYLVNIVSRDDRTEFLVNLDDNEYEVVNRIGELSEKAGERACQPVLSITRVKMDADEDYPILD